MMQFNSSASEFDRDASDYRDQARRNSGNAKFLIAEAIHAESRAAAYREVYRRPREDWQKDVAAFFESIRG